MQDVRVVKNKRPLLNTEQLGEKLFKKLKISQETETTNVNNVKEKEQRVPAKESSMALILYQEPACPKPANYVQLLAQIQEEQTFSIEPILLNLKEVFEESPLEREDESEHEMMLD